MDYHALKNLMRNYLGDIVDSEELEYLFVDDPDVEYSCGYWLKSKGFIHLHKCIMLTNKYPNLNNYLEKYFQIHNNINETIEIGWSALHLACANSRIYSTERTVEILINAGANVNLQNKYEWTALHYASRYSNICSTERTVELLINAGSNVNLQEKNGWSALHLASYNSKCDSTEKTIELLIMADADIFNLKDSSNNTPYDYFSKELKDYCQIDKATQTVGIKIGRLTKCAKK